MEESNNNSNHGDGIPISPKEGTAPRGVLSYDAVSLSNSSSLNTNYMYASGNLMPNPTKRQPQ